MDPCREEKKMEIGSVYEINPKSVEFANSDKGEILHLKEVEKYEKKDTVYTASIHRKRKSGC